MRVCKMTVKAGMVECVTVEVNGSMTVVFRDGTERRL